MLISLEMEEPSEQVGLDHIDVLSLPNDVLSEDMEYPSCPECDRNPGFLTRLSPQAELFLCAVCDTEFGDASEIYTSRNLPRPIRDDFAACVIGGADPKDQASFRDVSVSEVEANLEEANELLSQDWW